MPLQTAATALLDEHRLLSLGEASTVAELSLDDLPELIALAHQVRLA